MNAVSEGAEIGRQTETGGQSADSTVFVAQLAARAAGMGREVGAIFGVLEDVGRVGKHQESTFAQLRGDIDSMVRSNQQIGAGAAEAERVALGARKAVEGALADTQVLATAVQRVEVGLDSVMRVLKQVSQAAEVIDKIAFQTRIVAFNATVEAVRAGETGRGFAVVADAVKDLAQKVQDSSQEIAATVGELSAQLDNLSGSTHGNDRHGGRSSDLGASVARAIETFQQAFGEVQDRIHGIAESAQNNGETCRHVLAEVADLSDNLNKSAVSIGQAMKRSESLLDLSERMVETTALSGFQTDDTPFIEAVEAAATQIGRLFEEAIERGELNLADLFDERYQPVTGSNPQQHMTRFVHLTDRALPPLQESMLTLSDKVLFCAAVDRNGYLPTHNQKFSRPQGKDPVWNTANCRNRRIFNDRTGLRAARNQNRFLLQIYRRDMGGGNFVLMKDLSAPILVAGRHWGGLRMGYSF